MRCGREQVLPFSILDSPLLLLDDLGRMDGRHWCGKNSKPPCVLNGLIDSGLLQLRVRIGVMFAL